jgi:hypothetical protein
MIPFLAPFALAILQASTPAPEALAYRFEEVKRTVYRLPGGDKGKEIRVSPGEAATSGDVVRTGWLGRTVLAVPDRKARFEVFGSTRVKLASGEPGVLLVLEQGRIKAFFQALIEGNAEERQVAVPGALLAVRGTRYGVEVDKGGKSTLAVFEGVVEVIRGTAGQEVFRVKAGEWTTFGPGLPLKVETMNNRMFQEKAWSQGMRPDGSMMGSGTMAPGGAMSKGMRTGPGPMHM